MTISRSPCPPTHDGFVINRPSFAKYAAKNFVFINREQDADEEGLRQAKESYMPSGYLKKNTIRIIA